MLNNFNPPVNILDILNKMPQVFQLTGSYFFGNPTQDSDLDFFTQYNPGLEKSLLDLGFKPLAIYEDNNCVVALRFEASPWNPQIDIQLVLNFAMKNEIQSRFKQLGIDSPTKAMWNRAYEKYTQDEQYKQEIPA